MDLLNYKILAASNECRQFFMSHCGKVWQPLMNVGIFFFMHRCDKVHFED